MTLTSLTLAAAAVATLTLGIQQASLPTGSGSATCTVDESMENRAITGTLNDADVRCLEASGGEIANRLLMVHWFVAKDLEKWRQRAQIEINRGLATNTPDGDILYKVALHDSKEGDFASTYDLAGLALDALDGLDPVTREKRTFNLLKLRALAAMKQWGTSDDPGEQAQLREAMAAFEAAKGPEEE